MARIGYKTERYSDLGGGLNLLFDDTDIDKNECVLSENFGVEGNKMVTLPGYSLEYTISNTGTDYIRGLASYDKYIVAISNNKLTVINTDTGTEYQLGSQSFTSDYNITMFKLDQVYIVVNDIYGGEDMKAYSFNDATPIALNFSGLSSKKFTCSIFHDGFLFIGGNPAGPNQLYWSKPTGPYAGQTGSYNNFLDFSALLSSSQIVGDGYPITGFKTGQDGLYIFKKSSAFRVGDPNISYNDSSSIIGFAWLIKQVTNTGAISQGCIQGVEQDIFYFDGTNIRRISYETQNLAIKDAAISERISNYIKTLPSDQIDATSTFVYPYYKLFLRDKFSEKNNIAILYNVINKSFHTQTGINVSHACSAYQNKYEGFFGNYFSAEIFRDNVGYSRNGEAIRATYISRGFNFGDGVDFKRLGEVELVGKVSPGLEVTVELYADGKVVDTRTISADATLYPVTGSAIIGSSLAGAQGQGTIQLIDFRERFDEFVDLQIYHFKITHNGVGKFELVDHNPTYKFLKGYKYFY